MNELLPSNNTNTKKYKNNYHKRTMTIVKIIAVVLLIAGIGAVVVTTRKTTHTATILNQIETQTQQQQQLSNDASSPLHPLGRRRNKKSYILTSNNAVNTPWYSIQLPENVRPVRYDVDLDIDMENDRYSGHVNILIKVTSQSTKYILIHKSDIQVHSVRVSNLHGIQVSIKTITEYKPNEYLVIEMNTPLAADTEYRLECRFDADLRDDLTGLFVTRGGRNNSKIVGTFLSPVSARKFLPCFDEPDFKAIFAIRVTHGMEYKALSNMPATKMIVSANTKNATITTIFKDSLLMSTYNLGLLIADDTYKIVQKRIHRSLIIQVWDFEGNILFLFNPKNKNVCAVWEDNSCSCFSR